VVDQAGGRAVVGADPGLVREVRGRDRLCARERVSGRHEHARRIVEEPDELDVRGRRIGLELVLEDDRDVQLGCGQAP